MSGYLCCKPFLFVHNVHALKEDMKDSGGGDAFGAGREPEGGDIRDGAFWRKPRWRDLRTQPLQQHDAVTDEGEAPKFIPRARDTAQMPHDPQELSAPALLFFLPVFSGCVQSSSILHVDSPG
jgi:hypothetical protein